jgi:hypothetical protein
MSEPVPSETAVLRQLDLIVVSKTFKKARTGRVLLDFLVLQRLRGNTPTPEEIGLAVFGRCPGPGDAIVRVNLLRLHDRLVLYYETEGKDDLVGITIDETQVVLAFRPGPSPVASRPGIAGSDLAMTLEKYFVDPDTNTLTCVVTGEPAGWHHLDGDACHDSLGNLIPLFDRLREHIKALREGWKTTQLPELAPSYLAETLARSHFAAWRIAPAVACAHLAFHMGGRPFGNEIADVRILRLCDTISHLRHRFNESILASIIRDSLLPTVAPLASLDPRPLCQLALQLSGVLDETGCFDDAYAALAIADSVSNRFATLVYQPESLNRFSLLRRHAQLLMERQPMANKAFDSLASQIDEQAENNTNLPLTWQVVKTARAFRQATLPASKRAYETLLPIANRLDNLLFSDRNIDRPPRVDSSNLAQLFLFSGVAASRVRPPGWEDYTMQTFSKAERLSQETGYALPPEFWDTVSEDTFLFNPYARRALRLARTYVMPRLRDSTRKNIQTVLSCLNRMLVVEKADEALQWRSPWSAFPVRQP